MSKSEIIAGLPGLTPEERREILDRIWEIDGGDWLDRGDLSDEERTLVERRLIQHEREPNAAIPWEEVAARLIQRPET